MRRIEELYRNNLSLISRIRDLSNKLLEKLQRKTGRNVKVRIMNFCGTHEWTTVYYGIRSIVPSSIELVAGPGCPVCITPSYYVEQCIKLGFEGYRIYTYGDTYKVPTVRPVEGCRSLEEAKAAGCDVVVVYSFLDAIRHVTGDPRRGIFLGIGFETIAPAYAQMFKNNKVPRDLYFLSVVRLTPPAAEYTLNVCRRRLVEEYGEEPLFGVIAPGHVSTITGGEAWSFLVERYRIPVVVSGFEPVDVLLSICEILRQLVTGDLRVCIEYSRAVTWRGNVYAKRLMSEVFAIRDSFWRGIGKIPRSGLYLRETYLFWDAFNMLGIKDLDESSWYRDVPGGCKCGEIMLGLATPLECPHFLKSCTPSRPLGPCMVSSEGTCSIWARYGSSLLIEDLARELGI
ncbi:MAG: hydrogenase formation protein HypD [Crenarchaeota archaeon]|nr:hydrogenase formation protein HypD [Thermoproteota archaeon]